MITLGKSWCYLFNVWWDNADEFFEEYEDGTDAEEETW